MTEPRWQRYAPLGAAGFLLSLGLGAAMIGASSPPSDASATEIAAYFADHQGGLLANTLLSAFGGFVLFPWFLAGLYQRIRRVEGADGLCAPAALVGGIALLGPLLIQLTGWGAAALQVGEQRDPAVAAALFDLGSMGFLIFPLPPQLSSSPQRWPAVQVPYFPSGWRELASLSPPSWFSGRSLSVSSCSRFLPCGCFS